MSQRKITASSIIEILEHLARCEEGMQLPMGDALASDYDRDPFVLLMGCLLSLRARDTATYPVCKRLFSQARTPQELLAIELAHLENILKPIGFFHAKAATLRKVCTVLISKFDGQVPRDFETLLTLPGVGRKTANFMICIAFNQPALCVDTHVHRLANKFGWVQTSTPEQTEYALRAVVPEEWWCRLNTILVQWGQQVCKPRLSVRDKARHQLSSCPCAARNF